ncbi:TolC family protein [bacterium]|nr:TolC family protein [bacterium]
MRMRKARRARYTLLGTLVLGAVLLTACAPTDIGKWDDPATLRAEYQPALESETAEILEDGPALAEAIRLCAERNPRVEAARQRWLAAIYKAPQARSLPDPRLQYGYQFKSVETRVGPQQWNAGLTQTIPWWRKLWASGEKAELQAAIARLQYEATQRDLIVEVKDAYYELYYLDNATQITEKIEETLRTQGLVAYTELDSGRTQLGEAFRAESQAAQLAYDLILLREQRAAQAERLRSLLNLPPGTEIGTIKSAPVYEVTDDLEELQERAEAYREVLAIRGLEVQQAQYTTYLAKLSRIPDVGLGFNLINTEPARMAGVADSGKDPFIGLLNMNLPIWENRTRSLIKEKEAMEEAMRLDAMDELNEARRAVAKTFFAVQLTDRLATLYRDTLLPQAESVMGQAELDFRVDAASYSSVLETTLAYHNFLLAYHRAIADHGQAIGRLEKAVGSTAEARMESSEEVAE